MSITGGLEGVALEVLAGTTGVLSLGDVHRLAGTASKSGIRKALMRLVANGVVDFVPGGYTLNREHLACDAVLQLAGLRGKLFDRIRDELGSWESDIVLAGVFGSVARGEGDESSDIDLLIVGTGVSADSVGALSGRVFRWTGNECHVVVLTPAELKASKRANEQIVEFWRQDLVVLFGDATVLSRS